MKLEQQDLNCFFVSDLHGSIDKYKKLFKIILQETPDAVFIGGDLLPSPFTALTSSKFSFKNFISDFLVKELLKIKEMLSAKYPEIFVILGNDDGRMEEANILDAGTQGLWNYIHNRRVSFKEFMVYGYSFIPPSPFRFKDWEKYDVSRYVDPGCTAPQEGSLSIPRSEYNLQYSTISEDLLKLSDKNVHTNSIFLFHSPPYQCKLDRADLDGTMIDHVPVDVHIGSIAIQRFIKKHQPLLTLHGHVHESSRLTGFWKDKFNRTFSFNAADEGAGLCLIQFNPRDLSKATRSLF